MEEGGREEEFGYCEDREGGGGGGDGCGGDGYGGGEEEMDALGEEVSPYMHAREGGWV